MSNQPLTPAFVNVGQLAKWPAFLPQIEDPLILEHVWAQAFETSASPDLVQAKTTLFIDKEIVLSIPGLDAVALTVGAGSGGTIVPLEVEVYPELFIRISDDSTGAAPEDRSFPPRAAGRRAHPAGRSSSRSTPTRRRSTSSWPASRSK